MNTDLRYHRHRFPMDIISQCVWLYFRFCLSYRDVEEMMAERGVVVSYETIRTWCSKFGGDYAVLLHHSQRPVTDSPPLENSQLGIRVYP